jgi:glycosyltransferase involved in cell wall biosynthesis
LCFRREGEEGLESELVESGVRVTTVPFLSDRSRGLDRFRLVLDRTGVQARAMRHGWPTMVEKYQRKEMHSTLRHILRQDRPEVFQVEYSFLAPYARAVRFLFDSDSALWPTADGSRPRVLLNTHEVASIPRLRRASATGSALARWWHERDAALWRSYEARYVDWADTVLCVTESDRLHLSAQTGSSRLCTVPLGYDVDALPAVRPTTDSANRLLFVGSFRHRPNVDAVLSLATAILPRVWETRPDVVLDVVGADAPAQLLRAAEGSRGRIVMHGFVESLDARFDGAGLFVAPLFSGGGIKIKILEAMGRGTAVLTTPVGAEGIDDEGEACALAHSEEDFANQILELVQSPTRRVELGRRGRAWIEARFRWDGIVRELSRIAEESRGT